MKKHIIDAKGQKLGRVATEAAHHLLGKHSTDFKPNVVADIEVEIVNASQLDISAKKMSEKIYTHYTGYPSGLRQKTMDAVMAKKGHEEVVRKAVYGMLPSNKLRAVVIKNLIITE